MGSAGPGRRAFRNLVMAKVPQKEKLIVIGNLNWWSVLLGIFLISSCSLNDSRL